MRYNKLGFASFLDYPKYLDSIKTYFNIPFAWES